MTDHDNIYNLIADFRRETLDHHDKVTASITGMDVRLHRLEITTAGLHEIVGRNSQKIDRLESEHDKRVGREGALRVIVGLVAGTAASILTWVLGRA